MSKIQIDLNINKGSMKNQNNPIVFNVTEMSICRYQQVVYVLKFSCYDNYSAINNLKLFHTFHVVVYSVQIHSNDTVIFLMQN